MVDVAAQAIHDVLGHRAQREVFRKGEQRAENVEQADKDADVQDPGGVDHARLHAVRDQVGDAGELIRGKECQKYADEGRRESKGEPDKVGTAVMDRLAPGLFRVFGFLHRTAASGAAAGGLSLNGSKRIIIFSHLRVPPLKAAYKQFPGRSGRTAKARDGYPCRRSCHRRAR